jgi:hypothetical protein
MSTVGNGTTGASDTGPASGYNLVLSYLFIVFFLFLYRLSVNTSNPRTIIMLLIFTYSMVCFMIFRIKIYRKIPKTLTGITSQYLVLLVDRVDATSDGHNELVLSLIVVNYFQVLSMAGPRS